MIAAVFAMIIFQVLFPVFLIRMIDKKGIYSKPVILTASAKHLVDLVHGDKETPLGVVILGGCKSDRLSLEIGKFLQQFFRTVVTEAHQVPVLLMGCDKLAPFLCDFLQHIRVFQQFRNLLFNLRESAFGRQGKAEGRCIARIPGFFRKISGCQSKAFRKCLSLILHGAVKLTLRHIAPQIQKLPDTPCSLFPCQQGGITALGRFTVRNADTFIPIPNGILALVDIKTCTIGSVVLRKKSGIFLRRMVFHKVSANNQTAVFVVCTDTKRFVNDLLGKLGVRHKRKLSTIFLCRGIEVRKIKQRKLLAVVVFRRCDFGVDEVFLFVNELGRPSGNNAPRKNGLAGAGEICALPHQKSVLLGLIAHAHSIHQDFRVSVLVGRFQILGPVSFLRVNGEIQFNLLFLVFEVIIFVGDDGHNQFFVQKGGQLYAVRLRLLFC